MGRQTRGIHRESTGVWCVDKVYRGTRLFQRFSSHQEAEGWLIKKLADLRTVHLFGERPNRSFSEAATQYLLTHKAKVSIVTETYLLEAVIKHIGALPIDQVHDGTLAGFIEERLRAGRAHKTVNLSLGLVRRILNLASSTWRDESGLTWLAQPPRITMLPLVGHQREPRPITWAEQRALLPKLPPHLARMTLFVLNTGIRDDVACSLRWEWEIKIPELDISVFEVPREHVKGRRRSRVVICNRVAQDIIETARGKHPEFVFVYERPAGKTGHGNYELHPIETMNNTAWQRARKEAGLGDLHVHDLRHTVGMRLREAGVHESTISDVLWHSAASMTRHYSVAQVVELQGALCKIEEDSGCWNKSLATLRREQQERLAGEANLKSHANLPQQRKTA